MDLSECITIRIPSIYHPFIKYALEKKLITPLDEGNTHINLPAPLTADNDEITITGDKKSVANARNQIMEIYNKKKKTCRKIRLQIPKWQHKYVFSDDHLTIAEILQDTGVAVFIPSLHQLDDSISLLGPYEKLEEVSKIVFKKVSGIQCLEIDVPSHIRHLIMGKRDSYLFEIQNKYSKCCTEIVEDRIRVEGSLECIHAITQKLQEKMDFYLNDYDVAVLKGDDECIKSIVGIHELEEDFKVKINIVGSASKKIRIEGSKIDVASVKQELENQIVKYINNKKYNIKVSEKLLPELLPILEKTLIKLRDDYNVKFCPMSSLKIGDTINIRGEEDQVDACFKKLAKIMEKIKDFNCCRSVEIPERFQKFIIGEGRTFIKNIQKKTDTVIDIGTRVHNNIIVISGKLEKVKEVENSLIKYICENAESYIVSPVDDAKDKSSPKIINQKDDANSIVEYFVDITPKHQKYFLQKKKLLKNISKECGNVIISFPKDESGDNSTVSIKGNHESVTEAVEKVEKIISDVENETTIEIYIPNEEHRPLLRSKIHPTVIDIQKAHNVKIIFPDRIAKNSSQQNNSHKANSSSALLKNKRADLSDTVRIVGKEENCKAAEKFLLNIIPHTAKVNIPRPFRYLFIGNNNVFIQEIIKKFNVKIDVSLVDSERNTIIIRGQPAHSVDHARDAILEKITELENNYVGELVFNYDPDIDSLMHSGKFEEIRSRYRVKIDIEENTPSSNVTFTITGSQKDVEAAKIQIQKAVQKVISNPCAITESIFLDDDAYVHLMKYEIFNMAEAIFKISFSICSASYDYLKHIEVKGQEEDVEIFIDFVYDMEFNILLHLEEGRELPTDLFDLINFEEDYEFAEEAVNTSSESTSNIHYGESSCAHSKYNKILFRKHKKKPAYRNILWRKTGHYKSL